MIQRSESSRLVSIASLSRSKDVFEPGSRTILAISASINPAHASARIRRRPSTHRRGLIESVLGMLAIGREIDRRSSTEYPPNYLWREKGHGHQAAEKTVILGIKSDPLRRVPSAYPPPI